MVGVEPTYERTLRLIKILSLGVVKVKRVPGLLLQRSEPDLRISSFVLFHSVSLGV